MNSRLVKHTPFAYASDVPSIIVLASNHAKPRPLYVRCERQYLVSPSGIMSVMTDQWLQIKS